MTYIHKTIEKQEMFYNLSYRGTYIEPHGTQENCSYTLKIVNLFEKRVGTVFL